MNYDSIEENVKLLIQFTGDDPDREGLKDTPKRVIKMYEELLMGRLEIEPKITTFKSKTKGQVIVEAIPFASFCEHHILPFIGKAYVAYIPKANKVIGLSKIPRIIDYFSHRLQLQERLTAEIADYLYGKIKGFKPHGVIVVLKAEHTCMSIRGVQKAGSITTTSEIRGCYMEQPLREEFLHLSGLK